MSLLWPFFRQIAEKYSKIPNCFCLVWYSTKFKQLGGYGSFLETLSGCIKVTMYIEPGFCPGAVWSSLIREAYPSIIIFRPAISIISEILLGYTCKRLEKSIFVQNLICKSFNLFARYMVMRLKYLKMKELTTTGSRVIYSPSTVFFS